MPSAISLTAKHHERQKWPESSSDEEDYPTNKLHGPAGPQFDAIIPEVEPLTPEVQPLTPNQETEPMISGPSRNTMPETTTEAADTSVKDKRLTWQRRTPKWMETGEWDIG